LSAVIAGNGAEDPDRGCTACRVGDSGVWLQSPAVIAADRDEGHRQAFDRRSTAVHHLDDERLSQTLAHCPILSVAAHDAQLDSPGAGIGEGEILTAPDRTGHEECSQAMAIE